jgi:hypothetical protein
VVIAEGCLGNSNPNYTITDPTGTTCKLNVPPGADVSSLQAHIGESVAVMGTVNRRESAASANSAITALHCTTERSKVTPALVVTPAL